MATGKYEVAINGFNVIAETWDDTLNCDGNHDEVYFLSNTKVVKGDGTILLNSDSSSDVMGDIGGFPGRIQAGSAKTWWGVESGADHLNRSRPT